MREFGPALVWSHGEDDYGYLQSALGTGGPHWATMEEMAAHPDVDIVMVATTGKAGLLPTLAALRAGKAVALANKEVLVMAGRIITAAARQGGGELPLQRHRG